MSFKNIYFKGTRLFAIVFMVTISSCIKKIDWIPPELEQKPVINSVIKSGSPITIKVSLTVASKAQTQSVVDNAEVRLYVNNVYVETLDYTNNGFYKSKHIAGEENEYRCEVTIPDFQTSVCSTYIPKHQNIVKFEHINKAGVDQEGLTYPAIKLTFENDNSMPLFFEIVITLFGEDDEGSRPQIFNIVDPILLNEGLPIIVFSNELIDSKSYTMIVNYSTGSASRTGNSGWETELFPVQVELRTVCNHYYTFIKQQYLYEVANSTPIFSVGVTSTYNLYSNVENGYGIFAGYSSVKSNIIYP